jgi:hypothetical protein
VNSYNKHAGAQGEAACVLCEAGKYSLRTGGTHAAVCLRGTPLDTIRCWGG